MVPTWTQNGPPKSHLGAFGPKSAQTEAQNVDLEAFLGSLQNTEIGWLLWLLWLNLAKIKLNLAKIKLNLAKSSQITLNYVKLRYSTLNYFKLR